MRTHCVMRPVEFRPIVSLWKPMLLFLRLCLIGERPTSRHSLLTQAGSLQNSEISLPKNSRSKPPGIFARYLIYNNRMHAFRKLMLLAALFIPAMCVAMDEMTVYDLLAPDTHKFAIRYDTSALKAGSQIYFNIVR